MLLCFGINRFHLFALLTWQFAIFFASQMIFPIFSNFVPRWRCDNSTTSPSAPSADSRSPSSNPLLNFTAPSVGLRSSADFSRNCSLYTVCPSDRLQFEQPIPFRSAALHFGWICGSDAYKRALYSQAQFGGVLLGTFSFGAVSDAFGRKPIAIFVLTFGLLAVTASAFAPTWQFLLATRFLVGLSIGGTLVVVCTFVMEMILPAQRMALRAFINWGIARLALTLLCLLFPDWQSASIACALASLPALLFVVFIFPESPTWLHSKNRLEQMRASEQRIARIAGVPFTDVLHKSVPEKERSFRDLIHEKALFKRVAVLWAMWFTAAICGYSIDLNSAFISGDLYLNQSLLSVLIALSKVVLVLFDTFAPRFSRRDLHQYSQLVVILCFLLLSWLVLVEHQGIGILLINLIGTVFIEFTWDACYLCAVESVPTPLRASSVGSCSLVFCQFWARIGALFAPVLVFLNSLWAASAYLAVVLLGSLNLAISFLWLVETKGVELDAVRLASNSEGAEEEDADEGRKPEMEVEALMPTGKKEDGRRKKKTTKRDEGGGGAEEGLNGVD